MRLTNLAVCIALYAISVSYAFSLHTNAELENRELVNINGTFYYFSIIELTAEDSVSFCNDLGMKLISFQTQEKEQLILDYLEESTVQSETWFWTSGVRMAENYFIWSGTGQEFTYTNWGENQPNDPSTSPYICVFLIVLKDEGVMREWWDFPCSQRMNFICEPLK